MASLIRIGNLFNVERNLDQLLMTIVDEAVKISGAERGTLFLLDGDELWAKTATGLDDKERIRFKASEGIAGQVASTGNPLNIPDAYADPRFNPSVDKITGYTTRNILCVPLIPMNGKVIGAFELLNKKDPGFTSEDEEILHMVASQAAIAISNVQMYETVLEKQDSLEAENINLKQQLKGRYAYPTIIGYSPPIQRVKEVIEKVSGTNANVLITGESGTGKELIARAIHSQSQRANKPFLPLNCAALPDSLLESELFGIEKGVATGVSKRAGYMEQANGGTLFLDEVGEMPVSTQVKLLRVMQERNFMRIGGVNEIQVDIRILAATNRNLKTAIKEGTFREDLFYRLNVFPIILPPLRDRQEDIPLLAKFILANVVEKMRLGKKVFSHDSITAMVEYPWPGNVREMENIIERSLILSEDEEVEIRPLLMASEGVYPLPRPGNPSSKSSASPLKETGSENIEDNLKDAVSVLEIKLIKEALEQTGGNQLQAAKKLGISREGLRKKMKRYQFVLKEGSL